MHQRNEGRISNRSAQFDNKQVYTDADISWALNQSFLRHKVGAAQQNSLHQLEMFLPRAREKNYLESAFTEEVVFVNQHIAMGMHFIVMSARADDGKLWHHLYFCTDARGPVPSPLDKTAFGCRIKMKGKKPRATIVPKGLDSDVEALFRVGKRSRSPISVPLLFMVAVELHMLDGSCSQ